MDEKKSELKELKEKLFNTSKNGRLVANDKVLAEADSYCEGYKAFLDSAKTERMAVSTAVAMAEKAGFKSFQYDK